MHAAIHQLLSLRDGEPVEAQVISHVENCSICSAELVRLRRLQQRLQSLTPIQPPADAWASVSSRMQVPSAPRNRIPFAIAAVVALSVVSGLLIREFSSSTTGPAIAETPRPSLPGADSTARLEQLVAQSRELDEMLQYLPQRPAVERVALAATIDTIEHRVQWLDQQLAYAPDNGLNEAQSYQLWRERVDLMDSLVKVRFAEGAPMSF